MPHFTHYAIPVTAILSLIAFSLTSGINPVLLAGSIIVAATPLMLAALGEMVVEKSGVLNLGVEGMMIIGAVAGFAVAVETSSPLLGLAAAAVAGAAFSLIFGFLTQVLLSNQVATGLALTLFGLGLAALLGQPYAGIKPPAFPRLDIPLLSDIPILGPLIFGHDLLVYFALALLAAIWWFLYHTRGGLVLRSVGENHDAAHALGYDVIRVRLMAIAFGGACAGLGGAGLSLIRVPQWTEGMTAGAGWIALAIVVFGSWRPGRVALGAYLFGGVTILQLNLQAAGMTPLWGRHSPTADPDAIPVDDALHLHDHRAHRHVRRPPARQPCSPRRPWQNLRAQRMSRRARLHNILEGDDPEWGRVYAIFSNGVIVLAVLVYMLSTLPELSANNTLALQLAEVFVITIFAADYFARLFAAPKPLGYALSFWGIIDLIAFLPALVIAGTDLTSARLLRLIQLARILKLMRLAHAFERLTSALGSVREQLLVFLVLTLIVLILASVGIYQFEHKAQPEVFSSVPHAMWWAVATLSTVGYGDIYPVTAGGKFFTGIVLLVGLAVIAVPTGLISAALVASQDAAMKEADKNAGETAASPSPDQHGET